MHFMCENGNLIIKAKNLIIKYDIFNLSIYLIGILYWNISVLNYVVRYQIYKFD